MPFVATSLVVVAAITSSSHFSALRRLLRSAPSSRRQPAVQRHLHQPKALQSKIRAPQRDLHTYRYRNERDRNIKRDRQRDRRSDRKRDGKKNEKQNRKRRNEKLMNTVIESAQSDLSEQALRCPVSSCACASLYEVCGNNHTTENNRRTESTKTGSTKNAVTTLE